MHPSLTSKPIVFALALAAALVAAAWWVIVPAVMATSTFFAVCGIVVASVWVVMIGYENGRPTRSLAQSMYDVESAAEVKRQARRSS